MAMVQHNDIDVQMHANNKITHHKAYQFDGALFTLYLGNSEKTLQISPPQPLSTNNSFQVPIIFFVWQRIEIA